MKLIIEIIFFLIYNIYVYNYMISLLIYIFSLNYKVISRIFKYLGYLLDLIENIVWENIR